MLARSNPEDKERQSAGVLTGRDEFLPLSSRPWGRSWGWGLDATGPGTPPPSLPLKGEEKGSGLPVVPLDEGEVADTGVESGHCPLLREC